MSPSGCLAQKIAVRFRKEGLAAFHSHHDMIRFWERAVRRAGLPVRFTQGFNPRPRLVFLHALGVGVASPREEVEIELSGKMPAAEILSRLKAVCGGTVGVEDVFLLPPAKKSRHVKASFYAIGGWPEGSAEALKAAVAGLLERKTVAMSRGAKGEERTVDIRPFIRSLSHNGETGEIDAAFAHLPSGTARPDEIAKLLSSAIHFDWRDLSLKKTGMTLGQ